MNKYKDDGVAESLIALVFIFTCLGLFLLYKPGIAESVYVGPVPPDSVAEHTLCFQEACQPVTYQVVGPFTIATSALPNGYEVLGWSGPCDQPVCPDIRNQAFMDLTLNAKRANRAQRASE